jgi:putative two-component system response regulator
MEHKVVVLDDYEPSLRMYSAVIERMLGGQVIAFSDPKEALRHLSREGASLCVVDFSMPGMDGVTFVQEMRGIPGRERLPVIMLTGMDDRDLKSRAARAGVNVFLNKPISAEEFGVHVRRLASAGPPTAREERDDEMRDLRDRAETADRRLYVRDREALQALFRAYAARDAAAAKRMQLAADIGVLMAIECRCSAQDVQLLRDCAFVYDIGKLVIPEKISGSPVALSPKAKQIAESHAEAGAQILAMENSRLFSTAAMLARHHHERYDGQGYPKRLSRENIFLGARIMAVADALVAMINDRADRKGMTFGYALDQVRRESGTHFDPSVVAALEKIKDKVALLATERR